MLDMLSCYLRSLYPKLLSGNEAAELKKSKAMKSGRPAEKYEHKYELSKKETPPSTAETKRVRFAETEQLISQTETSAGVDREANNVVRVKLKMTKKQAARLLSKCSDGGTLDVDDELATELRQIIVSNGCPEPTVRKFSSALHYHID